MTIEELEEECRLSTNGAKVEVSPDVVLALIARVRELEVAGCPRNECEIRQRCTRPTGCLSAIELRKAADEHRPR